MKDVVTATLRAGVVFVCLKTFVSIDTSPESIPVIGAMLTTPFLAGIGQGVLAAVMFAIFPGSTILKSE